MNVQIHALAWVAAMGFALTPSISRADHEPGHTGSTAAHEEHKGHAEGECACDHECTDKCSKGDTASCECKTCDCSKGKDCEHGKCKHDHKKAKARAMKKKAAMKNAVKKAVKKADSEAAAPAEAAAH